MTPSSLQPTVDRRSAQLERIKPLISLKTYDMLQKKLSEETSVSTKANNMATKVAEHRDRAQALPKTLFTQRSLPRKAIRID